jgi:hypothetical protein
MFFTRSSLLRRKERPPPNAKIQLVLVELKSVHHRRRVVVRSEVVVQEQASFTE